MSLICEKATHRELLIISHALWDSGCHQTASSSSSSSLNIIQSSSVQYFFPFIYCKEEIDFTLHKWNPHTQMRARSPINTLIILALITDHKHTRTHIHARTPTCTNKHKYTHTRARAHREREREGERKFSPQVTSRQWPLLHADTQHYLLSHRHIADFVKELEEYIMLLFTVYYTCWNRTVYHKNLILTGIRSRQC